MINQFFKVNRNIKVSSRAFTLPELLIAAALGFGVTVVAMDAMVSHLRNSQQAEALIRQRGDWSRASLFIESEIALSERVITNSAQILIPSFCGISSTEFRFALEIRRDLPLVIYGEKPSTDQQLPDNSLWRCGPDFEDQSGDYKATATYGYTTNLVKDVLIDGLISTCGLKIMPDADANCRSDTGKTSKSLQYQLTLTNATENNSAGIRSANYTMGTGAHSRVSPVYSFPDVSDFCGQSNIPSINADVTSQFIDARNSPSELVLCGNGYLLSSSPYISGSGLKAGYTEAQNQQICETSKNCDDIISIGSPSGNCPSGTYRAYGHGGNDRILGGKCNDMLSGGFGNDILIGGLGANTLVGGPGENRFQSGEGDDTIYGDEDLDIVFFPKNKSDYTIQYNVSEAGCLLRVTDNGNPNIDASMNRVEILIFPDSRLEVCGYVQEE